MAYRLVFNASIPDDLADAIRYYEEVSPGLADRFRVVVDQRFDDIAERPESFPVDVPPIRFAKISQFPYVVFFVVKSEFVSIIAIVHGSSGPGKWRDRQ